MALDKIIAPGYVAVSTVCKTGEFILYRAQSEYHRQNFVKVPASSRPNATVILHLEHELEIARGLNPAFAVRPLWIERGAETVALLLEDFAGHALASDLTAPLDLDRFFKIAAGVTGALAATHGQGVLHKDIKPENILLNAGPDGRLQVKLTGFGIASRHPCERGAANPREAIDGTLAYMAPEQTGRMNRPVDARSDLYALGVTFYQMLTGRLPFTASDPMEWIHCHIALEPPPPSQHTPAIPSPLSDIVVKLLAKSAEERYQTAEGLKADLDRCTAEWQADGRIAPFPLGGQDLPGRLSIPEKLYGREQETGELADAFQRVVTTGKPELVLISGYSGIGKSAVVNELRKGLASSQVLFAGGKFDQFKRDIPYGTLAQAIQRLVRQVLGKSEEEIAQWRDAVREAVGPNGQLVADLVPDLMALIGEQPAVQEVSPQEAQNRFNIVLRRLLGVFATSEHPLVLFLDDLQWLDMATVHFAEHLMLHPDVQNILILGAYRDNEVSQAHPLMLALDAIRKGGARVQSIVLAPLTVDDAIRLAMDTFHCEAERAEPLARLVYEKTGGNPFFMLQFLTALAEEGLVTFDRRLARWQWNLDRIRAKGFTDNVADLLVAKLSRLQATAQEGLKKLACLGCKAKIAALAHIQGETAEAVQQELLEAIQVGFVFQEEDSFSFAHDRVQEAAYQLIPESERPQIHLNIGRELLAKAAPEELSDILFDAVNHLNRGSALIADPAERARLADLNAAAGRRARSSVAYTAARDYFAAAAALMPDEAWDSRYAFQFPLFLDWAEAEYLQGSFDAAETLFERLLAQAKSDIDKAKVYTLRLEVYQVAGKYDAAVDMGIEALRLFGVEIPEDAEALGLAIQTETQAVTANLQGRNIEELANAPEATDPRIAAIVALLSNMAAAAYIGSRPQLYPLIALKSVNFSLTFGPTAHSSHGYSDYGIMLTALFGTPYTGYAFSEAAIKLTERFDALSLRALSLFLHGHMINFWLKPIGTDFPILEKGFLLCLDSGNLAVANYIANGIVRQAIERGDTLASVLEFSQKYASFALSTRNEAVYRSICLQQQFLKCLAGRTQGHISFSDESADEASCVKKLASASFTTGIAMYHTMKLFVAYLMGDSEASRLHAGEARKTLPGIMSTLEETTFHFLNALTLARTCREDAGAERDEIINTLADYENKFAFWAEDCPENFSCKHALVAAEIAEIRGDSLQAEQFFERAIEAARASGFIHWQAMANEAAGRFHGERGLATISRAYLKEARYCYERWGALAKVKQLEASHPWLLEESSLGRTAAACSKELDVTAILKAHYAISGEIVPARLAETLLRIVMENAGARKGYLWAVPKWELFAVAGDSGQIEFSLSPTDAFPGAPASLLNYVKRTRRMVSFANASTDAGEFASDEQLLRTKPKSVLCLPIMRQAKLLGVLYIENRLVAGVFTPERRTVLEMLASQAAISLENAQTYQALRESEAKYSQLVNASNEGICALGPDARITFVNARMAEMFGYRAEELCGRAATDLMFEEDVASYRQKMATRRQGVQEHYEFRFRRSDGEEVWALASATPVFDDEHRFQGSFAMMTDITERKRNEIETLRLYREMEQRVAERTAALEQVNKKLEWLSNSLSQGLHKPLHTIDGCFRILMENYGGVLGGEGQRHLSTVRESAEDMGRLIDHIVDLSRVSRSNGDEEDNAASRVPDGSSDQPRRMTR